MRNKKLYKRAVALVIAATLSLGMVGCNTYKEDTYAYEAEAAELEGILEEVATKDVTVNTDNKKDAAGKEETVYVLCDANGNKREVIVSEWLKNPGDGSSISDKTELSDIKNVKGDEAYTPTTGDGIAWENLGEDIYYEGKTEKSVPVEVKVSYFLDGKAVSSDEIAGKSGKITIRFDYINNSKVGEVYTPFVMATGMILDNEKFSNVEVKNGKVISDGNRQVVIGMGMPGLAESLQLEDENNFIPEFFEVSFDATEFELGMTLTYASSGILDSDSEEFDLEKVRQDVKEMTDELMDGVTELADGIKDYTDGVDTLSGYLAEASDGTKKIYEGSGDLKAGITDAKNGTAKIVAGYEGDKGLVNGAKQLKDGAAQFNQIVSGVSVPGIEISEEAKAYTAEVNKQRVASYLSGDSAKGQIMSEINAAFAAFAAENGISADDPYYAVLYGAFAKAYSTSYVSAYSSGYTSGYTNATGDVLGTVNSTISEFAGQLDAVKAAAASLDAGSAAVYNGVVSVYNGTKQVNDGLGKLEDGATTINNKLGELSDASSKIVSGANELTSNNKALVDGSTELKDKTGEAINSADEMADRIQAIKDAGDNYQTFAGKDDSVKGTVKFIIKTDEIKK